MKVQLPDENALAALSALPDAALLIDARGGIVHATALAETLFGHVAQELIGRPVENLIPTLDATLPPRPMESGLQLRGLHKDGHAFPLIIGLTPVEGTPEGLVACSVRDISKRRRLEDRLRRTLAQLETAKNEAQRANEMKTRFLTAVSHDLRQPLQSIAALAGVLSRKAGEPESRAVAAKMEDSIGHMVEMIDSLLDIGQIESGEIKPDISAFPIAVLLERKAREFEALADLKGVGLRFVPSSSIVRSDPHLLERIVGNLLSNAVKYTERGRILLGCRHRGRSLRIEIWDTGIGIAREHFQNIFREFYRIDPADSAEVGLGLGLYFVRHVSSLLGHPVELESRSGKGTMFSVTVPLVERGAGMGCGKGPGAPRRPTILLVEDDPTQLRDLGALLEAAGFEIVAARRGEDALSAAQAGKPVRPDVIICDYNLGSGMKGPEIIQSVRSVHRAHIPALVLTADRTGAAKWNIESNGIGYLGKPVKASALLAAVDALAELDHPGWTKSERPPPPGLPAPSAETDPDIGVVDDDPDVRDALRLMLEAEGFHVVAYPSGEAFLADQAWTTLRCLIVDLRLPHMQGVELQDRLRSESIPVPIVFMTGKGEVPQAVQAMRAGAADFLQKPVRSAELIESVRRAIAGHEASEQNAERAEVAARLANLTRREREVLAGMMDGKLNKVIASELGISIRTTEHHREAVMRKMNVKSLAMLIRKVGLRAQGETTHPGP